MTISKFECIQTLFIKFLSNKPRGIEKAPQRNSIACKNIKCYLKNDEMITDYTNMFLALRAYPIWPSKLCKCIDTWDEYHKKHTNKN